MIIRKIIDQMYDDYNKVVRSALVNAEYCRLIDELCAIVLIPDPSSLYEVANLTVRTVEFSMLFKQREGAGDIFVYCGFGVLPAQNREEILLRLLETNLQLFDGPCSPTFTYNVESERVVMVTAVLMEKLTAQLLLDLLGRMADAALMWRRDFLMNGIAPARERNVIKDKPMAAAGGVPGFMDRLRP